MSQEHHLARQAERHVEEVGADHRPLWYDGHWYRQGALFDRVCRLSGGLRGVGVEPGDRVVAVMANSPHNTREDVSVLMRWFDPAGALDLIEQHHLEQTGAQVVST